MMTKVNDVKKSRAKKHKPGIPGTAEYFPFLRDSKKLVVQLSHPKIMVFLKFLLLQR